MKKTKSNFSKKEVILLLRHYLYHQRILSQLPVCGLIGCAEPITKEIAGKVCDKIRDDGDIENFFGKFEKCNIQKVLNEIENDKKRNQ